MTNKDKALPKSIENDDNLTDWERTKNKAKDLNYSYLEDFQYKHLNPYHDELGQFEEFVMRDDQAEFFQNKWSQEVFKKQAPLHVEIGTGFGHFMLDFCADHENVNFVGLDYRFKRSYQLAKRLSKTPYKNFKYLRAKGERLAFLFGEKEIDQLYFFFPDPWPKTKHHKKRLFQPPFLKAVEKCLKDDGIFYVKTDHDQYFEWMLEVLSEQDVFEIKMKTFDLHKDYPDHLLAKYITKFEKIFMGKGITTKALALTKKTTPSKELS